MSDFFKIYLDRLRNGETDHFSVSVAPDFLDCQERELQFDSAVDLEGKAYTANDHLVVCLNVATKVSMPCSICNQMIPVVVTMKNFYLTKALEECTSPTYDFREALREQILLEIPAYVECNGGCKEREFVKKFMKKDDHSDKENLHFPFSGLDDPKDLGDNYGRT